MNFIEKNKLILILEILLQSISLTEANEDIPLLQEIFMPRSLNENQTIKFNCDLVQGKQPVKIEWYFKNRKLENDNKYKIRGTEDSASLMIRSLSIDDLGEYFCFASNEFGNHKRHASVYVNSKLYETKFSKSI